MTSLHDARVAHWREMLSEGIDIVLWARGTPCRVAWPLDEFGHRISAFDLLYWLRARNLVWTCLCPADNPHGCQVAMFFQQPRKDVAWVTCGSVGGQCGFNLDLVAIRRASHLHSRYEALAEGQTAEDYASAITDHSSLSLSMAPCIEGLEGVFVGWCGCYDAVNTQPGIGISSEG